MSEKALSLWRERRNNTRREMIDWIDCEKRSHCWYKLLSMQPQTPSQGLSTISCAVRRLQRSHDQDIRPIKSLKLTVLLIMAQLAYGNCTSNPPRYKVQHHIVDSHFCHEPEFSNGSDWMCMFLVSSGPRSEFCWKRDEVGVNSVDCGPEGDDLID
jgi:hypothetical protein